MFLPLLLCNAFFAPSVMLLMFYVKTFFNCLETDIFYTNEFASSFYDQNKFVCRMKYVLILLGNNWMYTHFVFFADLILVSGSVLWDLC